MIHTVRIGPVEVCVSIADTFDEAVKQQAEAHYRALMAGRVKRLHARLGANGLVWVAAPDLAGLPCDD